jgi:hypothetical protein
VLSTSVADPKCFDSDPGPAPANKMDPVPKRDPDPYLKKLKNLLVLMLQLTHLKKYRYVSDLSPNPDPDLNQ